MERNISFEVAGLTDIAVHLAWAQLEIFADDVEKIQVMAAGDENSTNDLRIEVREKTLTVEQPQYGLSLNIMESRWLQVCIRVPRNWENTIHCNTISGLLSARKLSGSEIALETVSGDLRAMKLHTAQLVLKTVSGDMRGEELVADTINLRNVSGDSSLDSIEVDTLKCSGVSGEQTYNMAKSFKQVEVTAVSGNVIITAPVEEMNVSLRSLSGRVHTNGVSISESTTAPAVRVTGVSADLKLISIKE